MLTLNDQPVRKVRQHDLPSLEKGWGLRLLGGGGGRGRVGVGGVPQTHSVKPWEETAERLAARLQDAVDHANAE